MKKPYIFLTCALVIFTLAFVLPAIASNAKHEAVIPDKFVLHVVKKGDTLWDLSKKYMPGVDPRKGVFEIRRVNGMPASYVIQPGDVLNIPSEHGTLDEPLSESYSSPEAARKAEEEFEKVLPEAQELQASRGLRYRELVMEATAYTQRPEEGTADGITFTGTHVRPGVVAVDPEVIPLGSWVYIESDYPHVSGYYHAEDIGGAIKGKRVDIFMRDLSRAFEFGRREVRVVVIE